jgi:hypothetical protein
MQTWTQILPPSWRSAIDFEIRFITLATIPPFAIKFKQILRLNQSAIQDGPGRGYQSPRGGITKQLFRLNLMQN